MRSERVREEVHVGGRAPKEEPPPLPPAGAGTRIQRPRSGGGTAGATTRSGREQERPTRFSTHRRPSTHLYAPLRTSTRLYAPLRKPRWPSTAAGVRVLRKLPTSSAALLKRSRRNYLPPQEAGSGTQRPRS